MNRQYFLCLVCILMLSCAAFAAAEGSDPLSLPSLKTFYADYFDFGSAMNVSEVLKADLKALYASQYSIITPENELKPENVLDLTASKKASQEDQGNVVLSFQCVKPLLEFAKANGLKVHGHVLFWHSQTPDEFFRESYSKTGAYVSRDVMLTRMENYVRLTMDYMQVNYPGLIVSWDVVNEAIDDSTGKLRQSNWTNVVGDDFVLQAFRFARKYAPEGTLLFYNDYSTPYQPKLNGILKLLDELIAEDLADGYGMQCHYQMTTPTVSQVSAAIEKIVAKGLLIRVSEMDILVDGNTDALFAQQANRYAELMKVFLQYSDSILAVQTWGTLDNHSWKSDHYPLLFNKDLTPKPAFYALTDPAILPSST
jgi:endo-1,4-beta-xylanase